MTDIRFTPGPWNTHPIYDPIDGPILTVEEGWDFLHVCIAKGETIIGEVQMHAAPHPGFPRITDAEECRANAHLIAAAPEMYEALKSMVDMMDSGDEHGSGSLWHKEATAALAKAEGKVSA